MAEREMAISYSIIIPTRNRPEIFRRALNSVVSQTARDVEIIVVNDGSEESFRPRYAKIAADIGTAARFYDLPATASGHGHSFALNYGAARSSGTYLCFLDDDDEWTDPGHLTRVSNVLATSQQTVDVYLAGQQAYRGDVPVTRSIWLEELESLALRDVKLDPAGAYTVTVKQLLRVEGFCHLNTTTIRRELFNNIGGLDNRIRYEEDRDFYLRAIDQAALIKYSPLIISRHNIPAPDLRASLSTSISSLEKLINQLRVFDKAIIFAKQHDVRRHGREHKVYALKKIAQELAQVGSYRQAAYYAREALPIGPNPRWLVYCLWLLLRSVTQPRNS